MGGRGWVTSSPVSFFRLRFVREESDLCGIEELRGFTWLRNRCSAQIKTARAEAGVERISCTSSITNREGLIPGAWKFICGLESMVYGRDVMAGTDRDFWSEPGRRDTFWPRASQSFAGFVNPANTIPANTATIGPSSRYPVAVSSVCTSACVASEPIASPWYCFHGSAVCPGANE